MKIQVVSESVLQMLHSHILFSVPKTLENLKICQKVSTTASEVKNEFHFLFACDLYKYVRKTFSDNETAQT